MLISSKLRPLRTLLCSVLLIQMTGCALITDQNNNPNPNTSQNTSAIGLSQQNPRTPVLLISIDGFKPEYLNRGVTPNLNALAQAGVQASAMTPSYPSITFPNHYTLVTGLRPDQHGIVGNTMEDPALASVRFTLGNRAAVTDRRWWDQAEPVWVSAEKNGLRSATLFWPGSEAAIHGVRPSLWKTFDSKLPETDRVQIVLQWLAGSESLEKLPEADRTAELAKASAAKQKRPAFLTLYFDSVDHAGHEFGPDTAETTAAVAQVDLAIGQLIEGLKRQNQAVNLVIVSDHGMAATSPERIIALDKITDPANFRMINSGTYAGVEAKPGQDAALAASLLKPHQHMQCYRKQNLPARLEFGHNPRVPNFICMADVGWLILENTAKVQNKMGGAHGYDNLAPEMQAIFIASGPDFKTAARLPVIDNLSVYPLLMHLLGLPAQHGSLAGTKAALKSTQEQGK